MTNRAGWSAQQGYVLRAGMIFITPVIKWGYRGDSQKKIKRRILKRCSGLLTSGKL
jgi:hypothetical protein